MENLQEYLPDLEKLRKGDFSSRLYKLCDYFSKKRSTLYKRFNKITTRIVLRHTDSQELKEAITKVALEGNCISPFYKLNVAACTRNMFDDKEERIELRGLYYIGIKDKNYIATKKEAEEIKKIAEEYGDIDYACEKLLVMVDKIQDSDLAWDALVYVMKF